MQHKYRKYVYPTSISVVSLIVVTAIVSNFVMPSIKKNGIHSAASADNISTQSDSTFVEQSGSGSEKFMAAAEILHRRLSASGGSIPGVQTLANALAKRDILLKRSVDIVVTDPTHPDGSGATWTVSLQEHPELVTFRQQWPTARYAVDESVLAQYIIDGKFAGQKMLESVNATEFVVDKKNVTRAKNIPVARDGYDYDAQSVANSISAAIAMGQTTLKLEVPYKTATVSVTMNGKTYALDLLASGLSNYTGSPDNRIHNVKKAVRERTNNIVVNSGATFSYVDALDAPITLQKGWVMGLGLFGGGAAMTPGAGICQAATTIYRAALLAGLPIVEKRNHSMFVDHYEPYGVGLDATVFPGVHDMRFRNDTAGPILIQAYIDEDKGDVTVNFYGIADHRTVTLDGPYFWNTKPRAEQLAPLGRDQIGWVSTVIYPDGKKIQKPIVATYYKGFFHSVTVKYANTPGMQILHAEPPYPAKPDVAAK